MPNNDIVWCHGVQDTGVGDQVMKLTPFRISRIMLGVLRLVVGIEPCRVASYFLMIVCITSWFFTHINSWISSQQSLIRCCQHISAQKPSRFFGI